MKLKGHSIITMTVAALWGVGGFMVAGMLSYLLYCTVGCENLAEVQALGVVSIGFSVLVWVGVYSLTRVLYAIEILMEG